METVLRAGGLSKLIWLISGIACGIFVVAAMQLSFLWAGALLAVAGIFSLAIISNDFKNFFITLLAFSFPISANRFLIRDVSVYFRLTTGVFITAVDFPLIILYFHWIFQILKGRKLDNRLSALAPVGLILLTIILSMFLSSNKVASGFELILVLRAFLLYIYLIYNLNDIRNIKFALYGLFAFLLVQFSLSFLQFLKKAPLGLSDFGEVQTEMTFEQVGAISVYRPSGVLINANLAGVFYVLALPLLVAALFWLHHRYQRLLAGGLLLLGIAALIMTFSRASWLGIITASAVFLVLGIRRRLLSSHHLRYLAIAMALVLVIILPFSGKILARLTASNPQNYIVRWQLMDSAVAMVKDRPLLGFGGNTFAEEVAKYDQEGRPQSLEVPVHNIYLLIAAEHGILGLAAFLYLIFFFGRRAISLIRDKNMLQLSTGVAVLAGLAGFLIVEIFDPAYKTRPVLLLIWFMVALTTALDSLKKDRLPID